MSRLRVRIAGPVDGACPDVGIPVFERMGIFRCDGIQHLDRLPYYFRANAVARQYCYFLFHIKSEMFSFVSHNRLLVRKEIIDIGISLHQTLFLVSVYFELRVSDPGH